MNDEIYYLEATNEYESGNLDDALWAKLMALLEGNTEKAKYEYIKTRAERLLAESVNEQKEALEVEKSSIQETATIGKVSVAEYAKDHGMNEGHVVDQIRGGYIEGGREGGEWFVFQSTVKPKTKINEAIKRDFMSVSEFSDQKGIAEPKVIEMIREGFYVGRKVGDDWFVSREELWDVNNRPKPKVQPKPKPKAPDYITAKEFAASKGLDELKVIQMIRDGFYSGRLIGDAWHIESSELNQDPLNENNEGFLERLVKGEFSLPVHYWLFAVLGNLLLNVFMGGLIAARNYDMAVFVHMLSIIYNIPVLIGLWRAAAKYTGPSFWTVIVQVLTVLAWISLLGNTVMLFKSL